MTVDQLIDLLQRVTGDTAVLIRSRGELCDPFVDVEFLGPDDEAVVIS